MFIVYRFLGLRQTARKRTHLQRVFLRSRCNKGERERAARRVREKKKTKRWEKISVPWRFVPDSGGFSTDIRPREDTAKSTARQAEPQITIFLMLKELFVALRAIFWDEQRTQARLQAELYFLSERLSCIFSYFTSSFGLSERNFLRRNLFLIILRSSYVYFFL